MLRCVVAFALLLVPTAAQEALALVGATVHVGDGSPPLTDAVVLVRDGVLHEREALLPR